jgi:YggT family protein
MQLLYYVLSFLLPLVVVVFLLRVLMPLVRADFRNPLGEFVLKVTNPLVLPLRKVLPPGKRFDTAAIAAVVVVQLAGTALLQLFAGQAFRLESVLIAGLLGLLLTVLQLYFFAVLAYAVLSWFADVRYNPAAQVLTRIVEPVLMPIRRVIPTLGGLDLSALVLLIALQFAMRLVQNLS